MIKILKTKPQLSPSLSMSPLGNVRVGPIMAIPSVLSELGVDPLRVFAQAGVDPRIFDDPDNRMPLEDIGKLFDSGVALSDCEHLGLLVGQRCDLANFGPLGQLMRNSATVGEALRSLLLHFHFHDRGAAPVLFACESSCVVVGYSIYRHGMPAVAHILDASIAIGYNILTELCGPTWKPRRVQFSHSQPSSSAPYGDAFRSNIRFEAEISGIVFASSWLDMAIEGADAKLHAVLAKAMLDAEANGPLSFVEQVERVLPQMIMSGMALADAVARLLAIHERTLRRRLADEGTNFQKLLNQARFELAQQLLRNTGLSVSEIATALRYDDPNAFSRAFRSWAKFSPTQWRARH